MLAKFQNFYGDYIWFTVKLQRKEGRKEEQESKSRKKIDKRKKRKDLKSHKHSSDKGFNFKLISSNFIFIFWFEY